MKKYSRERNNIRHQADFDVKSEAQKKFPKELLNVLLESCVDKVLMTSGSVPNKPNSSLHNVSVIRENVS